MKEVYSHNQEDWVEDFQTAYEHSVDECLYDHDKPVVYRGDAVPVTHKSLCKDVSGQVVEALQEWAFDKVGEHSEGYLDDLDAEKMASLDAVVCKWLDDNAGETSAYNVVNIKEQHNAE